MKKIEDYIHLYLGADVMVYNLHSVMILHSVSDDPNRILVSNGSTTRYVLPHEIKLILRPLSSMTEDELKECDIDLGQILLAQFPKDGGLKFFSPNQFIWLLNKSFDLFGLIESGLALDATKIEKV